jgi:ribokinase
MTQLRLAVVGHVEHVTLGRAARAVGPGEIVHLADARFLAGGGGGLAFSQLCRSDAEIHFFTAVGGDEAGRAVEARIAGASPHARVHAAKREEAHPRVMVVVDPAGRRTIVVSAPPLQPRAGDALPWELLAGCDGVYFTGADPATLTLARAARRLVVTARRLEALRASGVAPDVVVGSASDPREDAPFSAYHPPPGALVLTDGAGPLRVTRAGGAALVPAPAAPAQILGDYGAGDSFAAALTYFTALGLPVEEACRRAGPYGAAVLAGIDPTEVQAQLTA